MTTPPKEIENGQAKILWDFQIKTVKIVVANQPDIVVFNKQDKKVVVAERRAGIDVESRGIMGRSGDGSTLGYNPQAEKVAPTNPRNNT